jgi:hypothetical protein
LIGLKGLMGLMGRQGDLKTRNSYKIQLNAKH